MVPVPVHHGTPDRQDSFERITCPRTTHLVSKDYQLRKEVNNKVIFYSVRLSEDDDEENYESDTDESSDEEVDESTKKKVKWKDGYDHTNLRSRSNIITFKHSSVEPAAVSCP